MLARNPSKNPGAFVISVSDIYNAEEVSKNPLSHPTYPWPGSIAVVLVEKLYTNPMPANVPLLPAYPSLPIYPVLPVNARLPV